MTARCRSSSQQLRIVDHLGHFDAAEVIRHDVAGALEPEIRNPRQDFTLAGNRFRHDDIECRQAVRGDDQHVLRVDRETVAYLALVDQRELGDEVGMVGQWVFRTWEDSPFCVFWVWETASGNYILRCRAE